MRAAAREAASGGRVLDVSGRGLGALPLDSCSSSSATCPHRRKTLTAARHSSASRRCASTATAGDPRQRQRREHPQPDARAARRRRHAQQAAAAARRPRGTRRRRDPCRVQFAQRRGGRDAHPPARRGRRRRRRALRALRHVDLSANSLDAIPPSLCALPKVDTIKLAHNRLTTLYASGGGWVCATPSPSPRPLEQPARRSGRAAAPASGERMRTLSLENNALTAVPAALSRLSALNTLGLVGNPQRQVRQGCWRRARSRSWSTCALWRRRPPLQPPTTARRRRRRWRGGGGAVGGRRAGRAARRGDGRAPGAGAERGEEVCAEEGRGEGEGRENPGRARLKENLQTLLRTQSSWIDPKSGELLTRL